MKNPERTAFIISNPQLVTEILNSKPARFHIFLVGDKQVSNANVTVCRYMSFHDTAVRICQEMLQRGLSLIMSDAANRPLQQKVSELIGDSCGFALSGAVQNALENLWHNVLFLPGSRSIDSLRGAFQGLPCILVASGPSLQKNVHLLNELKSNAVLISCGSALVPLHRRGITPHFEVVVDPNPPMYETLKPALRSSACFLISLMAHYRLSVECAGPRLYFPVNFGTKAMESIGRLTGIRTVLPAIASVATTALFFALHAGCDPIVFVGQDLCYAEGRTHIDGPSLQDEGCILEALDGRQVRSSPAMKETFDFYADFIPTIQDHKIINATEGGAGIRGAEHLSLAEAAARYLAEPITLPDLPVLEIARKGSEMPLKEIRNNFNTMQVKAAGFQRKIQAQLELRKDEAAIPSKIISWFESLRMINGYEYLAGYLDWVFYKADTSEGLNPKLELLTASTEILQQQIGILNEVLKT